MIEWFITDMHFAPVIFILLVVLALGFLIGISSPSTIKRFIYWISLLLIYVIIPWGIGSVTLLLVKPYIDQPTMHNPGISMTTNNPAMAIAILVIMIDCGASIILTLIGFVQFVITSFKSITKERRYY